MSLIIVFLAFAAGIGTVAVVHIVRVKRYFHRIETEGTETKTMPSEALPTRNEVMATSRALSRKFTCHDLRCRRFGGHSCHNLSCSEHKQRSA